MLNDGLSNANFSQGADDGGRRHDDRHGSEGAGSQDARQNHVSDKPTALLGDASCTQPYAAAHRLCPKGVTPYSLPIAPRTRS